MIKWKIDIFSKMCFQKLWALPCDNEKQDIWILLSKGRATNTYVREVACNWCRNFARSQWCLNYMSTSDTEIKSNLVNIFSQVY